MSKKIATSITNISKVDLLSYILSLIGAGLFTLFIIGSLFPFAQSTTLEKVIILFLGVIAGFIVFRIIWLKVLIPNIQDLKNHWVYHSIIAFVFTFFVISLSLYTPPLSPIELQFTIQTSQPFAFSHSFMEESFGKRFILDSADYRFEGEWNHNDGISEHMGYQKGTIRYSSFYFSTGFFIDFVFPTLEIPSSANILINGIDYSVIIPDSTTAGKTFIFRTENLVLPSYSTYYRILSTIHPYARGILLYYLFFSGSVFIRSHTKKPLELILHYSLFWIFSYLFFISLNFQDINFNILNHNVFLLFMVTMAFVAIPIGIMSLLKKHPRSETWLLLLILVIALGVRLYWVQMVPTGQVSDFGRFHYRALQLAEGEPGLFIDKYSVFTRLLSLVYRIAPSADLVIGINIFLSLLSIFCLYWIGKEIGYPVAGVLAGYFFSIFPSEISMVGIVCTDIPSATILLLIAALLLRYFKSPKWYWLAGAGLLFAIIFRIRAHMLMYFPIFLVPLFFSKFHSWKKIVQYGATFLISFFLGITMINGIVNQISVEVSRSHFSYNRKVENQAVHLC
jgi:hypothetical protein